jgi:hypothetical protein
MDFSPLNEKTFRQKKYSKRSRGEDIERKNDLQTKFLSQQKAIEKLRCARTSCCSARKIKKLEKELAHVNKGYSKTLKHELASTKSGKPNLVAHGASLDAPKMLTTLKYFITYLQTIREEVGEEIIRFSVDVFTTLYNIYKTCTWESVSVNLTSLLIKYFPTKQVATIIEWFSVIFEVATAQSTQAATDFATQIKSFIGMCDSFFKDMVWTSLYDFFIKVSLLYHSIKKGISFESFDLPSILANSKELMEIPTRVEDIFDMAFQAYEYVMGNWDRILARDFSIFLLGKEDAKAFEVEVRVLEQAYPFAIDGKEVLLKTHYNMTVKMYEKRLTNAIKKAWKLSKCTTSVQQKLALSTFVKTLTEKQHAFFAKMTENPSREQPYAVKLAGPSSCGKSFLTDLMSKTILSSYGHDPSEGNLIVTSNIAEKYESTIEPTHKLIVCDDVANRSGEKINYDRILNYINTVPRPLEKAAVNDKGCKYPGNDAVIVTTNCVDLKVADNSNCPESILRRFPLHVHVSVREQFRNEYGGLIDLEETRFDVYDLSLERFECMHGKVASFKKISRDEWADGHVADDGLDFQYFLRFLGKDIQDHRTRQLKKMAMNTKMLSTKYCGQCNVAEHLCLCSPPELDTSSSETELETQFGGYLSTYTTAQLWDLYGCLSFDRHFLHEKIVDNYSLIQMYRNRHVYSRYFSAFALTATFGFLLPSFVRLGLYFFLVIGLCGFNHMIRSQVEQELNNRLDRLSSVCITTREHFKKHALKYFAGAASFYVLYRVYNTWKVMRDLSNNAEDTVTFFDEKADWLKGALRLPDRKFVDKSTEDERDYKEGYSRLPPKVMNIPKTTSADRLEDVLKKTLRVVVVKTKGEVFGSVNGMMVSGNIILVPNHAIPETTFDLETSSAPDVVTAKTKDQRLSELQVYRLPERDLCLVHLPSAPPGKNLLHFFAEEEASFRSRTTRMIFKGPSGEIFKSKQALRPYVGPSGETYIKYRGYRETPGYFGIRQNQHVYHCDKPLTGITEFNSFPGMCGAPYIDNDLGLIYGFHIAGLTAGGSNVWVTNITRPMLQVGIDKIMSTSPHMVVASLGDVRVDTYGTDYTVVPGTPLFMREDGAKDAAVVTYMGKVLKGGAEMVSATRTPYVPTPFKGVEIFGERKHRPPKDPNDVAKTMSTLNKLTNPVQHYEHDVLGRAIDDYKQQTLKVIKANKALLKDHLRIYSQDEAMNGTQDGHLFGLPNDTSAGFPIQKSKKKCLVRDPMDESLVKIPREFNEDFDIQKEIDRTLEAWANGERSEPIYKASSKVNELLPNKKAIAKVRKFYGSPFANFIASRRVLAGVPEFIRMFQEETECFVGVNATSEHWQSLHDFLTTYSSKSMIAGDFAGFDTRMAGQITTAAAGVIMSWYAEMGLSTEELSLIRGALSDICNPNILIDGDLYRFANGNPSGNLITVQLNSICNSIMMRYVYYKLNPRVRYNFAHNVKLATYGDDNAMGVRKGCDWFNHTACQRAFAEVDIEYTMAHKDAESVPYIGIDDISFLKRDFKYHADLRTIVAPIELDSIYKKFYWIKKSSECPLSSEEQFGAYTDGAIREAFLHGEEFYHEFLGKLRHIVSLNPSLQGVISFIPYAEMLETLKPDYVKGSQIHKPRKFFAESVGLLTDTDADFESTFTDFIGDF